MIITRTVNPIRQRVPTLREGWGTAHEARPLSRSLVRRLKINNGGLINSMAGPEGHAKELLMRLEPRPAEPLNRICLCPLYAA